MNKEKRMKKIFENYKRAAVYARKLGFDRIDYSDYGGFKAEHKYTTVTVSSHIKYGSLHDVEICWASAGTPRPDNRRVKRTAEMLLNAIKLKNYLLGKR